MGLVGFFCDEVWCVLSAAWCGQWIFFLLKTVSGKTDGLFGLETFGNSFEPDTSKIRMVHSTYFHWSPGSFC